MLKVDESSFNYQMRRVIEEFIESHEDLKGLEGKELQEELYYTYAEEFAHEVLDKCYYVSKYDLFKKLDD